VFSNVTNTSFGKIKKVQSAFDFKIGQNRFIFDMTNFLNPHKVLIEYGHIAIFEPHRYAEAFAYSLQCLARLVMVVYLSTTGVILTRF
jgi:hypothetical protein